MTQLYSLTIQLLLRNYNNKTKINSERPGGVNEGREFIIIKNIVGRRQSRVVTILVVVSLNNLLDGEG